MPQRTCDLLVSRLNRCFGEAQVIGNVFRWAVKDGSTTFVVGIDRCEKLPIKVWVFDPTQKQSSGIHEFQIASPEEADAAVRVVVELIRSLAAGRSIATPC